MIKLKSFLKDIKWRYYNLGLKKQIMERNLKLIH